MPNLTIRPVVVGVDGTEGSTGALRYAVREAQRSRAELHIVHVTPGYVPMATAMPYLPGEIAETGRSIVAQARQEAEQLAPQLDVEETVVSGGRIAELVEAARDSEMLVVGRKHRGALSRLVSGSTTGPVAAHASTSVVAVPEDWQEGAESGRIVVGLKDAEDSSELVETAYRRAELTGAVLDLLHAWHLADNYAALVGQDAVTSWMQEVGELIESRLREIRAGHPTVVANSRVVHDEPARALIQASDGAALLMIARRHSRLGDHLGTTARTVLHHASCPVFVVPPSKPSRIE